MCNMYIYIYTKYVYTELVRTCKMCDLHMHGIEMIWESETLVLQQSWKRFLRRIDDHPEEICSKKGRFSSFFWQKKMQLTKFIKSHSREPLCFSSADCCYPWKQRLWGTRAEKSPHGADEKAACSMLLFRHSKWFDAFPNFQCFHA